MKITNLKPAKVFYYFGEISKIPHGSGNTEQLALYCMDFAEKHGLKSYRDKYGNVMIFKNGTIGYEESEPVIIQGHLDMVCEKNSDCIMDMEKESVKIVTDGEYMWADGTTLGGDDGIAVAYALALLESDDIPHPPLEVLLTSDEEIGLRGANALDASRLKGRRLINIDSEEEGVFTVSCAGGIRLICEAAFSSRYFDTDTMCVRKIKVGGLLGGHSGIDINKHRKNAVKILGDLLYELNDSLGINIADCYSGGRPNVIPRAAEALVCFDVSLTRAFEETVAKFSSELKNICSVTEPDVYIMVKDAELPEICSDEAGTEKIIFALMHTADGVYAMSPDIPELVQTSSNMGAVSIKDGVLKMELMVRSNTDAGKKEIVRKLFSFMEYIGGRVYKEDDYPAWEYRQASPLRDIMTDVYCEMYGKPPEICAIHAGLECGILDKKISGADMVSIGPNMEKVHTPRERINVKSAERCWNFLLKVLEKLK